MKLLLPQETQLVGSWDLRDGKVVADEVCERITNLVESHLVKIGISVEGGGWETLYCDPADGRYWEQKYQQSELQGGGPPSLFAIEAADAKERYSFG